ncbi:hypothetical protein FPL14_26340 [Cohnella cholangitidis]|uniref:2-oxo acid dehydrogenase subunit E2 n=1 Tax=Cohnella cholangitidis TaxID=2598458 RepID=A0A7G5C509_9BACL|nr:hypothetical protein FPL14_26340 [Cohnella cholangitidis]
MAKQIIEITMPQLAESLVTATIDRWLKQPGDMIDMYEPICDLITDKVNAELPSTVRGKLVKHLAGSGETVDVGAAICLVEVEVSDTSANAAAPVQPEPGATGQPVSSVSRPAGVAASGGVVDANAPMRHRYSPAVQMLASEHGIDLNRVSGTGEGGRITRKDVLAAAASGTAAGGHRLHQLRLRYLRKHRSLRWIRKFPFVQRESTCPNRREFLPSK